jgi:DNA-binding CsgD family transcriptional regulator
MRAMVAMTSRSTVLRRWVRRFESCRGHRRESSLPAAGLSLPLEKLASQTFSAEIAYYADEASGVEIASGCSRSGQQTASCVRVVIGSTLDVADRRGARSRSSSPFAQPRLAVCAFVWADVRDRTRRTLRVKRGWGPDRSQAPEPVTANDDLAWLCTPVVQPVRTVRRWRHAQSSWTSVMATTGAAQVSPSAALVIPEADGDVRTGTESQGAGATSPVVSLPKRGGAIRGIGEKFGVNPKRSTQLATMRRPSLLELTFQLAELPDRQAYLAAACVMLPDYISCDEITWGEVNFRAGLSVALRSPDARPDVDLARVHLSLGGDHPVARSYLHNPRDLAPRRVTDICSQLAWRGTRAFALLSPYHGPFELTLGISSSGVSGSAWIVNRGTSDFNDNERDLAAQIQPVLVALDRLYRFQAAATSASPMLAAQGKHDVMPRLTSRELDILALVAAGLKADAIGRLRRISPRTVRKHLENLYAKLGEHDRLTAVARARHLGLLTDGTPPHQRWVTGSAASLY